MLWAVASVFCEVYGSLNGVSWFIKKLPFLRRYNLGVLKCHGVSTF